MLFMVAMVLVTSLLVGLHETQALFAKEGCQETCGTMTIPYPFGVGTGCYSDKSFEVLCNTSTQNLPPLRFANHRRFPILEISNDSVRAVHESTHECLAPETVSDGHALELHKQFVFSQDRNRYVAVGCNISAAFYGITDDESPSAYDEFCTSLCSQTIPVIGIPTDCSGLNGCCQLTIPQNLTSFAFFITNKNDKNACVHAFIAEKSAPIAYGKPHLQIPVALNWVIAFTTCNQASQRGDSLCGNNTDCVDSTKVLGYNCRCKQGYNGNPYLPNGCQEAAGETCENPNGKDGCIFPHRHESTVVVSVTITTVVGLCAFAAIGYIKLGRIKKDKIKKKLYEKYGGYLLEKQISANKSCVIKIKLYTAEEMEKATENFSRRRFLGKGGQGTVYKGLLPDKTVVAIKKSNVVDQAKQFVNEIFILTQINHRNIVKLLGCCLEYEVPLLVYEYLPNDNLSQHLHDGAEVSKLAWTDRVRIAKEVAGALAYLHSYTSPSIFHRDIKPNNILLDANYKAVVSDFGLSRLIPLSITHLTTKIEGTFGYLDPEYFQSGQLTAKSDVYSFGVVLIELLTRKSSIFTREFDEGLIPKFNYLMKHNCVVEILDKQIVQESLLDDVLLLAKLAKKCVKTKRQKRPSMKDVVTELDKLRVQL